MTVERGEKGAARYQVPLGVEIATAWAWRGLLIVGAGFTIVWLMRYFSQVTVPIAVALLGTALTISLVDWLARKGLPRILATFVVVVGLVALLGCLGYLVGSQLSTQFGDMRESVVQGIAQVQDWAKTGPLHLTDRELDQWIDKAQEKISDSDGEFITQATEVGTLLGHFVAGAFIALFALFFFLYEGQRIWGWALEFSPKEARTKVHSSGIAAWGSLTAYVRATVLVALVDAIGIALAATILGVPLAFAIGVLVFLGAFIPIIGALVSGMVAVLVALVDQGPVTALLMLAGVIIVQQIESHVLQPFLMGRMVAVHPLAIIIAIAAGVAVAGIVGALIAVPFAACADRVVRHLAHDDEPVTDGILGSESRKLRDL